MLYTDSRNDNGSYMKSLAEECYQGAFQFDALLCGVQIHGGRNFHRKSLSKQVKVRPHVSFVVLLKGELTFTIDHKVYRFEAQESGRLIMISLKEASVFGRLANAGNYCEKLVLRGMEYWLKERVSEPSLTHGLYQQAVRDWPLNESLRQLSEQWLMGEDTHKALPRSPL